MTNKLLPQITSQIPLKIKIKKHSFRIEAAIIFFVQEVNDSNNILSSLIYNSTHFECNINIPIEEKSINNTNIVCTKRK